MHVATLNIRNLSDRWDERLPLLLADMRALQPDVMGLQEVVFPLQQDRLMAAAGEARYDVIRGPAGRPEYGNAILVREGLGSTVGERVELGHQRSAVRSVLTLPSAVRVTFATTHLHHVPPDEGIRDEQAAALNLWLTEGPATDAEVVVGDFNAEPTEPAYRRMTDAGFRSAHLEANGVEPAATWPSGIQAPAMDTDGDPGCLDYIWVRGSVRAEACRIVFDRPAVGDPTLYPSDHFGLSAQLVVGER